VAITARRRSAVAGFALGSVSGVSAHLSELLVDAAIRGEGVGSQLLAAFVSEAAARGAEQVSLRTESGSDAEKFYAARGWRVVATLPRYRFNRDFVHMLRRT
jgi:GNAT superfamily N-acetyltransferase